MKHITPILRLFPTCYHRNKNITPIPALYSGCYPPVTIEIRTSLLSHNSSYVKYTHNILYSETPLDRMPNTDVVPQMTSTIRHGLNYCKSPQTCSVVGTTPGCVVQQSEN